MEDLTGQKFSRLTVIEFLERRGKGYYWRCKCDCGNEIVAQAGNLKSGNIKSCGCLRDNQFKDLTGMKFNRLKVLGRGETGEYLFRLPRKLK